MPCPICDDENRCTDPVCMSILPESEIAERLKREEAEPCAESQTKMTDCAKK